MWFETHNKAEQGRYDGMTGMTLKYAQMIDMEMDQNQLFCISCLRLDEDPFTNYFLVIKVAALSTHHVRTSNAQQEAKNMCHLADFFFYIFYGGIHI